MSCFTNHQNKPLFLMVLKDANGEAHIGNISVLPSQKRWVFNDIFNNVFTELNGESTICCNCLILTDKDTAEVESIMNTIVMIDAYHGSEHLFCMFHALANKFKELVFPKLLHEPGGKKLNEHCEKHGAHDYGF